jgi:hypothetical protein
MENRNITELIYNIKEIGLDGKCANTFELEGNDPVASSDSFLFFCFLLEVSMTKVSMLSSANVVPFPDSCFPPIFMLSITGDNNFW